MRRVPLIFAVTAVAFAQTQAELCDLLKNLEKWDGQMITVRAPVRIARLGRGAVDGPLPALKPGICDAVIKITDYRAIPPQDHTFPNQVELTDP
jgi:hypothetical protein